MTSPRPKPSNDTIAANTMTPSIASFDPSASRRAEVDVGIARGQDGRADAVADQDDDRLDDQRDDDRDDRLGDDHHHALRGRRERRPDRAEAELAGDGRCTDDAEQHAGDDRRAGDETDERRLASMSVGSPTRSGGQHGDDQRERDRQDDQHLVHADRAELDPFAAQGVQHQSAPAWYSCTEAVAFKKASSSDPVCVDSSCNVTL